MKKIVLILICIVYSFLLSSCDNFTLDATELMKPPQPTGEKAEIQKVIEENVGGDFTLKYPCRGEYRSAIIMRDIDKNGVDEAIALLKIDNDEDNYTHIMFIGYTNNMWRCIGNYINSAQDIDTVLFGDINNDGNEEIIIGWNTYTTGLNTLSSYIIEKGKVREMNMEEKYSEIMLVDIDNDSTQEIMLISLSTTDNPSSVSMLKYSAEYNKPILKSTAPINHDITRFTNIQVGNIDKDKIGIVIDGYKNNSTVTDMIYWNDEISSLINPLMSSTDIKDNVTTRNNSILSCDINKDGIIEIPVVLTMLATSKDDLSSLCMETYWRRFDSKTGMFVTARDMVINNTYRFFIDMPPEWNGNVTARTYENDTIMCFYEWKNSSEGESYIGSEIIRYVVKTRTEYQAQGMDESYKILYSNNQYVVLYKINEESIYKISAGDIVDCFGVLSDYEI